MLHAWYMGHIQPSLPYPPNIGWHGHLFQWGILVGHIEPKNVRFELRSDPDLVFPWDICNM
jgi:hypothetical protein